MAEMVAQSSMPGRASTPAPRFPTAAGRRRRCAYRRAQAGPAADLRLQRRRGDRDDRRHPQSRISPRDREPRGLRPVQPRPSRTPIAMTRQMLGGSTHPGRPELSASRSGELQAMFKLMKSDHDSAHEVRPRQRAEGGPVTGRRPVVRLAGAPRSQRCSRERGNLGAPARDRGPAPPGRPPETGLGWTGR